MPVFPPNPIAMSKVKNGATAAAFLLTLMGCAISDDSMARFLVAPGKYELYSCPELLRQASETARRQHELEQLITKAGQDASGQFVSTLAYRPDYLSARGEMRELREAARAKNCDLAQIDKVVVDATATGTTLDAIAIGSPPH
jgi:hypothetical protein